MRSKLLTVALVFPVLLLMHAVWMPAKALLAEQLIKRSWHHYQTSGEMIPPWPWADTQAIALLTFHRIDREVVVLNGADPTTLAFSVGALSSFGQMNSTKPFVIAGHNDSHFAFLRDIHMKDIITLADAAGRSHLYQVEAIEVIDVHEQSLSTQEIEQGLVLITCYPFDLSNSGGAERYIIKAKRLTGEEQA